MLLLFSVLIFVGIVVVVVLTKTNLGSPSASQNKGDQTHKVDTEKSYTEAIKLLENMSEHRPKSSK